MLFRSSELSTCHETINNLRNENARLIDKVDSHVCNVSIPNPGDNNDDLLARIEELNISLASLRLKAFLGRAEFISIHFCCKTKIFGIV